MRVVRNIAVTPGAVIPAREMLAQLLAKDHPQQALAEYQTVLKSAPNRFNATYGAAMAARAAGDPITAAKFLRDLSTFTVGDERYKREWCDGQITLYDHVAPATLRGIPVAMRFAVVGRIKRWIKQTPVLWDAAYKVRAFIGPTMKRLRG